MHFVESEFFAFGDLIWSLDFLNFGFWILDFCRSWIFNFKFRDLGVWILNPFFFLKKNGGQIWLCWYWFQGGGGGLESSAFRGLELEIWPRLH